MLDNWRHLAICSNEDPELFFPTGSKGPTLLQIAEAKSVCRRCPVVADCLAWALSRPSQEGVCGGMTEDERKSVRRREARTRQRAAAFEGAA